MEDEGLGTFPTQIEYVGSLLLFNTKINPYKEYQSLDNFMSTGKQKDDEIALKAREVDIKDRDSLVNADAKEAELSLKAEAQGHDMQLQIMQALADLQQRSHDMGLALQQMQMQAQAQDHGQQMAEQSEVPDGQV